MTANWLFCDEFLCHVTICEDPKVVNRRSCEHFVKISWQLLMRSRAVIWHPGDYFVTSYCDEWQLFDGWKIIFRRLVDDSVKMFDLSDDFATVTESLYDDLETTLWQASMKGQLYNNSMTALQILIWRPCDHAVPCDYTVTTLDSENKRSPIWQICGTVICHNDNLQCHQWWQCCQVDDLLLSVKISHVGPMTIR